MYLKFSDKEHVDMITLRNEGMGTTVMAENEDIHANNSFVCTAI